jgi:hypothetical protein
MVGEGEREKLRKKKRKKKRAFHVWLPSMTQFRLNERPF